MEDCFVCPLSLKRHCAGLDTNEIDGCDFQCEETSSLSDFYHIFPNYWEESCQETEEMTLSRIPKLNVAVIERQLSSLLDFPIKLSSNGTQTTPKFIGCILYAEPVSAFIKEDSWKTLARKTGLANRICYDFQGIPIGFEMVLPFRADFLDYSSCDPFSEVVNAEPFSILENIFRADLIVLIRNGTLLVTPSELERSSKLNEFDLARIQIALLYLKSNLCISNKDLELISLDFLRNSPQIRGWPNQVDGCFHIEFVHFKDGSNHVLRSMNSAFGCRSISALWKMLNESDGVQIHSYRHVVTPESDIKSGNLILIACIPKKLKSSMPLGMPSVFIPPSKIFNAGLDLNSQVLVLSGKDVQISTPLADISTRVSQNHQQKASNAENIFLFCFEAFPTAGSISRACELLEETLIESLHCKLLEISTQLISIPKVYRQIKYLPLYKLNGQPSSHAMGNLMMELKPFTTNKKSDSPKRNSISSRLISSHSTKLQSNGPNKAYLEQNKENIPDPKPSDCSNVRFPAVHEHANQNSFAITQPNVLNSSGKFKPIQSQ